MPKLVVTIDGPAASGKSTVAGLLASRLGAVFLDTGAMYRAVTLAGLNAGIDMANEEKLLEVFHKSRFEFLAQEGKMLVRLDGVDITGKIRSMEVTANARYVASAVKLREQLVLIQRQFAVEHERIVTEGRDQGTVAFADADVKFFLTADVRERAKRRLAELPVDSDTSVDQLEKAISERDNSDQSRDVGPLKAADDAIVVDTTNLTINQVTDKLQEYTLKGSKIPRIKP
jgi:cytidylate kinase